MGTYENGLEKPRIQVTLATSIPEDVCRNFNLGYCDPASILLMEWAGRENEGILLVPRGRISIPIKGRFTCLNLS